MKPIKATKASSVLISKGSGITEGLEFHFQAGKFILVDKSADGRFASDVTTWNQPSKKAPISGN